MAEISSVLIMLLTKRQLIPYAAKSTSVVLGSAILCSLNPITLANFNEELSENGNSFISSTNFDVNFGTTEHIDLILTPDIFAFI